MTVKELAASGASCSKQAIALVMEQFLDQRRRQLDRSRSFDGDDRRPATDRPSKATSSSSSMNTSAAATSTDERKWLEAFLQMLEVERKRNEAVEAERVRALHGEEEDEEDEVDQLLKAKQRPHGKGSVDEREEGRPEEEGDSKAKEAVSVPVITITTATTS